MKWHLFGLQAGLLAFALAFPEASPAQGVAATDGQAKAVFRAFDLNESGWLSGRELVACDCSAYDTDRNKEITWEEFRSGYARAPLFARTTENAQRAPVTAPAARTDDPASPMRAASTPVPKPTPADARAQPRFQVGQTVEVNVDGTWYKATIVNIRDGRYALSRHDRSYGVTTDNEWIEGDKLRPFVAKPVTAPAVAGLPRSVPSGLFECMTYGTGASVGKMRIATNAISSGVTPDGGGAQHRFSYDASTGAISWADGMTIAGWTVEQAYLKLSQDGTPVINLHYRSRAGGNLNSMSCTRR